MTKICILALSLLTIFANLSGFLMIQEHHLILEANRS